LAEALGVGRFEVLSPLAQVGTGGDSHTRFPIGISFPAGSGLVAFGAATGVMPLDMPESVLVRFSGKMQPGITLRDLVHAIPYFAIKQGLLTVAKQVRACAWICHTIVVTRPVLSASSEAPMNAPSASPSLSPSWMSSLAPGCLTLWALVLLVPTQLIHLRHGVEQ
jgi:hypothetical protein